jgi:hypothetical protein
MKKLFSLPYTPGMSTVIEELPIDQINDIYFSDNKFGSARALSLSEENLKELYDIREKYGIKLHYLINGNYYSNESYEHVDDMISHVKLIAPDLLTMNNTYLMRDAVLMHELRNATEKGIEIKNSVNNIAKTLKQIMFLVEVLGIQSIIVDRSLNRNLDELTKISNYCKERNISITMLVNEGCIVDCMWKNVDDMMIAQTNEKSNMRVINIIHDKLGCGDYFEKSAAEYLKTAFTLPNELNKFNGLVDVIKLAGRGVSIQKWLILCRSYMYEDGNVQLQHLFSTRPPNILLNTTANELAAYNFNKITQNCKNVCANECNLCDNVLEKMFPNIKVNKKDENEYAN